MWGAGGKGGKVKYRDRKQILTQKKSRTGKHANTWFLRGNVTNTLKTHFTPGGKLRDTLDKKVNSTINADGGKTKIVELAGKPILAGLRKPVNFGGNGGCQMGPNNNNQCIIAYDPDCRIIKSVYKIDAPLAKKTQINCKQDMLEQLDAQHTLDN